MVTIKYVCERDTWHRDRYYAAGDTLVWREGMPKPNKCFRQISPPPEETPKSADPPAGESGAKRQYVCAICGHISDNPRAAGEHKRSHNESGESPPAEGNKEPGESPPAEGNKNNGAAE